MLRHRCIYSVVVFVLTLGPFAGAAVQETGSVRGRVVLETNGEPIHGAVVLIVGLGKFTTTNEEGRFEILEVPAGEHVVPAQREHLSAERTAATVLEGEATEIDFELALSPIHEEVTVTTAAGGETTALDTFSTVTTMDSFELVENMAPTLGEILEEEPGIAKRSFGPGSARPIIRGFDGDRVLIMEDGIRTGDLSSQSGDHGVTIDPASLERIEVVKGPATLLYGSNAVGGVVNVITPHDSYRRSFREGVRGQVTTDAGSANEQVGLSGNVQLARNQWLLWAGGGGRRTEDYETPEGPVENSALRSANGRVGGGYFGDKTFFSVGYQLEDARYGIPFAGRFEGEDETFVDIDGRRQSVRFDTGLRNLRNELIDSVRVSVNYLDWGHDEIEVEDAVEAVGTRLHNEIFVVRAEVEQKPAGPLSGKFGFWSQYRDYVATGEEALAPPTGQNAFAGFAYEELRLGPSARLQFGGRLEHNDYDPEERAEPEEGEAEELEPPQVRSRSFTGASGSVGLHLDVDPASAFVANFTRSYRAPALEELYNFGPHLGNVAFEIGNPDLDRESTLGLDVSFRRQSRALKGNVNFFYYDIDNFVFPSFTGEVEDGLRVAEFLQGDSRFVGVDGSANLRLSDYLYVNLGLGYVNAKLTETDEFLPRIPPLHGRVELEIPYRSLTIKPELVWAAEQDRVFRGETVTDGYTVVNVNASYVVARSHVAHIFAVKGYNLTDALYRVHTSFIKDLAPEIGRGIKFSYSVRFF